MEINFANLELIWQHPEYYNTLYEFKNPESFLLEGHFKVMKKQPKEKDYCVKILFEEKHMAVCEGLEKELKKTFHKRSLFHENISILKFRKLSPKEQRLASRRYRKNKENKCFAYFSPKNNPFDSPPEDLIGKDLFGVFNISLGTVYIGGESSYHQIKLKINSATILQFFPVKNRKNKEKL